MRRLRAASSARPMLWSTASRSGGPTVSTRSTAGSPPAGGEVPVAALKSSIDRRGDAFRANDAAMRALVADLRAKVATIKQGGGEAARKRHVDRGKLLPRERIRLLLDAGSPFLELSQFAAYGLYGGEVPAAGLITGIGRVMGRECLVV